MKMDLVGKRFGRLIAIEPFRDKQRTYWKCICDCGNEKTTVRECLTAGFTKSCGCAQKEGARDRRTSHGLSKSPEYKSWSGMRDRCLNENNDSYDNYGGRGITICQRWIDSFELFYADMGQKPGQNYSIDRIDNDLGYSPSNCRWATGETQGRNRRGLIKTRETSNLKEAAIAAGITYGTAHSRVYRLGWDIEDAISTPARKIRGGGFRKTRDVS